MRDPSLLRGPITAIVAEREFGQSYADSAKVTFTIYRVARNREGIAGSPSIYLQVERTIDAAAKHCDVREALALELGIRIEP